MAEDKNRWRALGLDLIGSVRLDVHDGARQEGSIGQSGDAHLVWWPRDETRQQPTKSLHPKEAIHVDTCLL